MKFLLASLVIAFTSNFIKAQNLFIKLGIGPFLVNKTELNNKNMWHFSPMCIYGSFGINFSSYDLEIRTGYLNDQNSEFRGTEIGMFVSRTFLYRGFYFTGGYILHFNPRIVNDNSSTSTLINSLIGGGIGFQLKEGPFLEISYFYPLGGVIGQQQIVTLDKKNENFVGSSGTRQIRVNGMIRFNFGTEINL